MLSCLGYNTLILNWEISMESPLIGKVIEVIKLKNFPILLLIFGFLLIFLAYFHISDIKTFQLSFNSPPRITVFICGVLFCAVAVLMFYFPEDSSFLSFGQRIKTKEGNYSVSVGKSDINILFGRIEECTANQPCVIALPADEYFSKECLSDPRTACGAFLLKFFPGQIEEIIHLVKTSLRNCEATPLEKEPGIFCDSYGIANCAYLDRPLATNTRVVLVSTSTRRAGLGLHTKLQYIPDAMEAIHQVMGDKRLDNVYMPIFGAGLGSLSGTLALLYMLLAVVEVGHSTPNHFRQVNIVVFQADKRTEPVVSRKAVKRM